MINFNIKKNYVNDNNGHIGRGGGYDGGGDGTNNGESDNRGCGDTCSDKR